MSKRKYKVKGTLGSKKGPHLKPTVLLDVSDGWLTINEAESLGWKLIEQARKANNMYVEYRLKNGDKKLAAAIEANRGPHDEDFYGCY